MSDTNEDIRPWVHVGEAAERLGLTDEDVVKMKERIRIADLEDELDRARVRIAKLETAMRPFAAISPVILNDSATTPLEAVHYWAIIGAPGKSHFTREDLERARNVLKGGK